MGIKNSMERLLSQMDAKTRSEYLARANRSSKGTQEDILNFPFYFNNYIPKNGTTNGPELKNSKVYISLYHFLEYEGLDPNKYDTENTGLYFYQHITNDTIPCYYENYHRKIDKYEYEVLKSNFSVFDKFLK